MSRRFPFGVLHWVVPITLLSSKRKNRSQGKLDVLLETCEEMQQLWEGIIRKLKCLQIPFSLKCLLT